MNQKFADEVLNVIEDGDIVWIHDYQLLLCPQMIKEIKPEVTVGFFSTYPSLLLKFLEFFQSGKIY